ncbi:MAG: ZIP family metal transporter [Patescibacteria group bacterium]|jgi:zinc and cadmium transporter
MDTSSLPFILLITTGVGLIGLVGGVLLFWRQHLVKRWSYYFMSFAAGGLLGAAFLDLLPEALEGGETSHILSYTLLGVLVFFVIEKLLVWHHHSHPHDDEEAEDPQHASHLPHNKSLRPLIIFGDGLHNFLDGVIIAVAFLIDAHLGWVTALAVLAHEIPQEVGDFSILLSSGMARARVLFWNMVGALMATAGAIVGFYAHDSFSEIELPLLGFAAGNFIYIALADLFPTIQHERKFLGSMLHIALILFGLGLLYWVGGLFPHVHGE